MRQSCIWVLSAKPCSPAIRIGLHHFAASGGASISFAFQRAFLRGRSIEQKHWRDLWRRVFCPACAPYATFVQRAARRFVEALHELLPPEIEVHGDTAGCTWPLIPLTGKEKARRDDADISQRALKAVWWYQR